MFIDALYVHRRLADRRIAGASISETNDYCLCTKQMIVVCAKQLLLFVREKIIVCALIVIILRNNERREADICNINILHIFCGAISRAYSKYMSSSSNSKLHAK